MTLSALFLAAAATSAEPEPPRMLGGCAGPSVDVRFMMPTERYPHGALGDPREWAGLVYDGEVFVGHVLGHEYVFEDVEPRVADLDGDCRPEIVVVESHESLGAQLAVYALERGRLRKIAATPHLGARFRWLAPAGIADFDADGDLDIALVRTPHIEGVLEIWGFAPGGLTRIAAVSGVSNHRLGSPVIEGGSRDCGAGPEIVTADADWALTLVSRLEGDRISARVYAEDAAPETLARALACD